MPPSDLRTIALEIFHRTLAAIDIERVVRQGARLDSNQLVVGETLIDLTQVKCIVIIAIGKASIPITREIEKILDGRISDGLVATNAVVGHLPQSLPVLIGGHPLPNTCSLEAASRALEILHANDAEDTLVLFLISGGGSSLFEKPIDSRVTLDDLQAVNRTLVGCGALISEMNVIRRHLSAVKGGRLRAAAPRSRQISLYISDVNSDDLTTVASGPTLPSDSTLDDFHRIISHYRLLEQFPQNVVSLIKAGAIPAMPKAEADPSHRRTHYLLLDNRRALEEAKRIAQDDYDLFVEIAEDLVEGDVETMMQTHIERAAALRNRHRSRPVCLLSGGEVICPVRGGGQGGRNQEFVLRAAIHLEQREQKEIVCLSAGTDGIDGNSPAAGAIVDITTLERARAAGISAEEHLIGSDSFNFFRKLGDAIITGPTGNNVRDLRILLAN